MWHLLLTGVGHQSSFLGHPRVQKSSPSLGETSRPVTEFKEETYSYNSNKFLLLSGFRSSLVSSP